MVGEDLSIFFNTAEFAQDALLGGVAIRGIFDNGFASPSFGAGMATSMPTFRLPTASVPQEVVGKELVLDGERFLVAEHERDGTGVSTLNLEFAA